MRAARAAGLLLVWVTSCGGAPAPRPVALETRPAPPPAAPPAPPPATCAYLAIQELPAATPSYWGDTQPSVWLTEPRGGLDVWFPSGARGPFETARLAPGGSLGRARAVSPFAGLGEAANPVVASDRGLVAVAETVYRTDRDADILLALRSEAGAWGKPVAVLPSPDLDTDAALAFGGGGLVGVAWRHGTYPTAPDLSFAVVARDGRVLHGGVVQTGAQPEGIALAGVPDGWVLVYTPTSVLGADARGLLAMHLDRAGHVTGQRVVARGAALWPVAAWNGREVGVAYRDDSGGRGKVSFVRLRADATPLSSPTVADEHPDPLASFRPQSLVPARTGFWLGDVASFHASVMIARASEGRVVELDASGRPTASAVVSSPDTGASIVRLAPHAGAVRGVFVEDRGASRLRAFDVGCGAPPASQPRDACAARTEAFPHARFLPFRGLAESSVQAGRDLVVGYRVAKPGPYGPVAGNVRVSRLSPDGSLAWTADLGSAYHPELALGGGRVAVLTKTGDGRPESLSILDAATGAVVRTRALAPDAGEDCVVATASGWLVVHGAPYGAGGKPAALLLDADGALRATRPLDEPVGACSLLPTPRGYLLAYTHPGAVSETNFLFVRPLDAGGAAHGRGVRLPDQGFATGPKLVRRGASGPPVVLFADALGRNVSAVVLDDRGAVRSPRIAVAETYGLRAYALWGDEIVWSTEHALGRRGCLDALLAPR